MAALSNQPHCWLGLTLIPSGLGCSLAPLFDVTSESGVSYSRGTVLTGSAQTVSYERPRADLRDKSGHRREGARPKLQVILAEEMENSYG